MRLDSLRRLAVLALVAGTTAAFAAVPAAPGVLNFVEGQTRLNGQSLTAKSVGEAQLQQGNVLETGTGRAEVLLSPGVFLRLGENTKVRMLSPDLLDTRVELLTGNALVEAADLRKGNDIRIIDEGSHTQLLKKGLYRFNADNDSIAVYDGKAQVMKDDQTIEVKSGREVSLNGPLVSRKFDKKETEKQDSLYTWSKLRSEQLSDASALTARTYVVNSWGWPGSGWYWNPFFRTYAWMPGDAFFYSPFGAAYYSPFAFYGPAYYGPTYYRIRPRWRGGSGAVVRPGIPSGGIRVQPGINPGLGRRR